MQTVFLAGPISTALSSGNLLPAELRDSHRTVEAWSYLLIRELLAWINVLGSTNLDKTKCHGKPRKSDLASTQVPIPVPLCQRRKGSLH